MTKNNLQKNEELFNIFIIQSLLSQYTYFLLSLFIIIYFSPVFHISFVNYPFIFCVMISYQIYKIIFALCTFLHLRKNIFEEVYFWKNYFSEDCFFGKFKYQARALCEWWSPLKPDSLIDQWVGHTGGFKNISEN